MKKFFGSLALILILSLLIGILTTAGTSVASEASASSGNISDTHARPSVNGQLSVAGTALVDESGNPVQLRGLSSHGLPWYPDFINPNIFRQVSQEWDCDLIRLPVYSEIYCDEGHEPSLTLLKTGITMPLTMTCM